MVALQHQRIHPRQSRLRLRGHKARIREKTYGGAAVHPIVHALGGVMGGAEHRHPAVSHGKHRPRLHRTQQGLDAGDAVGQLPGGAGTCVNGDAVVLHHGLQAADVIRMLVGDEYAVHVRHGQPQLQKPRLDAACGNSGVQQQMHAPVRQQQAVPLGAAGQCMYGHQCVFPRNKPTTAADCQQPAAESLCPISRCEPRSPPAPESPPPGYRRPTGEACPPDPHSHARYTVPASAPFRPERPDRR